MKKKLMMLSLSFLAVILFSGSAFAQTATTPFNKYPDMSLVGVGKTIYTDVEKVVHGYKCDEGESGSPAIALGVDISSLSLGESSGDWNCVYATSPGLIAGASYQGGGVFKLPNAAATYIFEYFVTKSDGLCKITAGNKVWAVLHVLPKLKHLQPQRLEACVGATLPAMNLSDLYKFDSIFTQAGFDITWKNASGTTITTLLGGYVVKNVDTLFKATGVVDYKSSGVNCGDIDFQIAVGPLSEAGKPEFVCKPLFEQKSTYDYFGRPKVSGATATALYDKDSVKLTHFTSYNGSSDTSFAAYVYTYTQITPAGIAPCEAYDTVFMVPDFVNKLPTDTIRICVPTSPDFLNLTKIITNGYLPQLAGKPSYDRLTWTPFGQDVITASTTTHTHGTDTHAYIENPFPSIDVKELKSNYYAYNFKNFYDPTNPNACDIFGWLIVTKATEVKNALGRINVCERDFFEETKSIDLLEGLQTPDPSVTYEWSYTKPDGTVIAIPGGVFDSTFAATNGIVLGINGAIPFTYKTTIDAASCGSGEGLVYVILVKSLTLAFDPVPFCIEDFGSFYNLAGITGATGGEWKLKTATGLGANVHVNAALLNGNNIVGLDGRINAANLFAPGLINRTAIEGSAPNGNENDVTLVFEFTNGNCIGNFEFTMILTGKIN